jgi:glycosyltransferase involved in cell wall biosynthesis
MVSDVAPETLRGGAERAQWEPARGLAARGHDVRIVCRGDSAMPRTESRAGVEIRHFPVARESGLRYVRDSIAGGRRAAATEAARRPGDVLHLHQPLSGYGVLSSRLGREVPSLYTFHSSAPLEYISRRGMTSHHSGGLVGIGAAALLRRVERACLSRVSLIQVESEFSIRQLWELYRIPPERIVKIPAGADIATFRPSADRRAVRAELGLPNDRRLLLSIRNLEQRMGLDLLLGAVALIRAQHPDLLVLIGGAGSRRARLEALAAELALDDHVRFLGFIPEASLPLY